MICKHRILDYCYKLDKFVGEDFSAELCGEGQCVLYEEVL